MPELSHHTVDHFTDHLTGETRRVEQWNFVLGTRAPDNSPLIMKIEVMRVQREHPSEDVNDEDWLVVSASSPTEQKIKGGVWTDCPHENFTHDPSLFRFDFVPGEICDAIEEATDLSMETARR